MRVEMKLNVPASFFYDKVVDSVLFDIRQSTGKSITRKQLSNYKYEKKMSQGSKGKITVESLIENQEYRFRTGTYKGDYIVTYQVESLDDQSCKVIYTEKTESQGTAQKLNDTLMAILFSFFKKRQLKKMLKTIENEYK